MPSKRTALLLLLAVSGLFYLLFIGRTAFTVGDTIHFTLIDDAMISMRYARNLAQGNGLLWNTGQPPVEGISNLGWTLFLAVFHLLQIPQSFISLAVMLACALILLANTAVIYQVASRLAPDGSAPIIAAAVTAFYFPLVFWTLRGLETGALALCISLALLFTLRLASGEASSRDPLWLALALGCAILVRMDAILPSALIVLYLAWKAPRKAVLPGLVSLLVLGGVLLFQRVYFGDFLPNTYYLKVAGVTPWERIRAGLLGLNDFAWRDLAMPLFITVLGFAAFPSLRRRENALLFSLFAVQVAYSVWVGGDYAEELVDSANRFIAQGMPALILLFSLAVDRLLQEAQGVRVKPWAAALVGLGAVLVMSGEPWAKWTYSNAPMLRTDIQRLKIGLHVRQFTDPGAVIAVHAAGQIPYYSERPSIDLLGKNDPVIARGAPVASFAPGHNKWDYDYSILELKPDVVADNFNKLRSFMEDHAEYILLPNGLYVRADSSLVDLQGLGSDYH